MKKSVFFFLVFLSSLTIMSFSPVPPAVKWENTYSFDRCNIFKIDIFAKNNELMRTVNLRTYYQSDGQNFMVKSMPYKSNYGQETIIDKNNEVAIQIFSPGSSSVLYNAGGYKYPSPEDLKKLNIVPTEETKEIIGYSCRKYTYTFKKIFGEVWITEKITIPNDLGVFRACKMAAIHNTLSENGFVMEMTTEDSGGGRTVMTTVSLENQEKLTIDLNKTEISTAVNKVNYFIF